ncbi:MAG: nucleoside triphosphate pyrophosphohydrolase [Bacteroidetes bacterium]|nr:nucleoside triphosphate pyrophosphohydrolase [Bacteroidota bacterium]
MSNNLIQEFERFEAIIRRLRKECPWDKAQTPQSLAAPLIEEAYETVEAIENHNVDELKKELGDLFLHVIFQALMAEEQNSFTLEDVLRSESEKLIYRHPHIFGDTAVSSAQDVAKNWEELKRAETGRTSVLDGVPASLPALQRAARIQDKASKVGFDWPTTEGVLDKIREEIEEFAAATTPEEREDEFGDILFSLVNLSRHIHLEAERSLREATRKFESRFRRLEDIVERSGSRWSELSLDALDDIWRTVK